jgi:ornithine cyclodeaminase/alanine dehydrogenase-like protein (mu-crystallin family)
VVDTPHAIDEAGELIQVRAAGLLPAERVATLAALAAEETGIPADGMILFKSAGSALQDLALVSRFRSSQAFAAASERTSESKDTSNI